MVFGLCYQCIYRAGSIRVYQTILNDVRRHLEAVNALIEANGWLVGDHLSFADIAVAAMFFVINRAVEGAEMLDEFPTIRHWQRRVDELTL